MWGGVTPPPFIIIDSVRQMSARLGKCLLNRQIVFGFIKKNLLKIMICRENIFIRIMVFPEKNCVVWEKLGYVLKKFLYFGENYGPSVPPPGNKKY